MPLGQPINKVIPNLPGVNMVNNMAGDLNKEKGGTDEKPDQKQDPSELEGGEQEDNEKNGDVDTENQSKPPTA